jgi:RND family efflux transporter MFP subunit
VSRSFKIALPVVVLVAGLLGTIGLVSARPTVGARDLARQIPMVHATRVEKTSIQHSVRAQGSVVPRTESVLVAEVSGRIVQVSASLASGGFFEAGDVLAQIDPSDYEVTVERAQAGLARAESESRLANSTLIRIKSMNQQGVASAAALDDAQNAMRVSAAARRDARAALLQAERNLERTRLLAPFAGRVRDKQVDVGQFVGRGAPVARVYAVDYAEVRLPVPDSEAAFLDLPIDYRGDLTGDPGPLVLLRAQFAGREYTWEGRIVRTEGELDPRTRMIQAVARVENPYGRGKDPDRPPLAVGLFVNAEIQGRLVEDVVVIPRSALRGSDEVVVIDEESRLRLRQVGVLRRNRDTAVIRSGILPGEWICTSPLSFRIDGMEVRIAEVEAARSKS